MVIGVIGCSVGGGEDFGRSEDAGDDAPGSYDADGLHFVRVPEGDADDAEKPCEEESPQRGGGCCFQWHCSRR